MLTLHFFKWIGNRSYNSGTYSNVPTLHFFTAILHRLYIGQIVYFTFVRYHSTCKINEWQRKARAMKEKSRKNRWHFSWKQHEEVLKEEKI